jgi:SAM-dependent MidA family methyltransferase
MNMGIAHRVEQLINADHVTNDEANNLFEAMKKLVLPEVMGSKFKVMAIVHPSIQNNVPGFVNAN